MMHGVASSRPKGWRLHVGVKQRAARGRRAGVLVGIGSGPGGGDASVPSPLGDAFQALVDATGSETSLELRDSGTGRGVYFKEAVAPGDVVLRVPRGLCLVATEAGDGQIDLRIPGSGWRFLDEAMGSGAVQGLPWYMVHALALCDAAYGGGDPFWAEYAECFLPRPEGVTVPVCLPDGFVSKCGHASLRNNAAAQREKLQTLGLPEGVGVPLGEGLPTLFQWSFACVRSRAFAKGDDRSMIPFMDMANHSSTPNCDFGLLPDGRYALFAVKDAVAGEEATISYEDAKEGYTNQRWMAQYGFVPAGGNPFDRLDELKDCAGVGDVLLDPVRMQRAVGTENLYEAMLGNNDRLFAALKSLPMDVDKDPDCADETPVHGGEKQALEALKTALEVLDAEVKDAAALPLPTGDGDPRIAAIEAYRLEREALVAWTMRCVELYESALHG